MGGWVNYGICIADETKQDEIIEAVEETGLIVYSTNEAGFKCTESMHKTELDSFKSTIRPFLDSISAILYVEANDTDGTASGTIYTVRDGSLLSAESEHSGGEDSRHHWSGITYDGLRIDGGRYY